MNRHLPITPLRPRTLLLGLVAIALAAVSCGDPVAPETECTRQRWDSVAVVNAAGDTVTWARFRVTVGCDA